MSLFYLFIYLLSSPVFAQDIEVNSIKIEGNSVIEDETILSYIPFKSDSNLNEEKQNQIIESLYSTGFFNDILLIIENNILYISVKERPVIAGITFDGQKSLRLNQESVFEFKFPRYADLLMDTYLVVNL